MKIAVDKNAPVPAYKQVVDGIALAIHRGDVDRGSRLPSVRNLALDLGLNVNTVARAYRDLERAGVIQTMPGMGSFVPEKGGSGWASPDLAVGSGPAMAIRGDRAGVPASSVRSEESIPAGWQDWLAAAHSLARAEGVSRELFAAEVERLLGQSADAARFLMAGASAGESADLLRALPPELAAGARVLELDELGEADASVGLLLTSFPGQAAVRQRLGQAGGERVEVVPVETEFTERTLGDLAALPDDARLALVTVEKSCWDNEANDVMKIIGRSRWLKTVFLENAERGLAERLVEVDAVLHVPRARDVLLSLGLAEGKLVELGRQVTPRTRERLERALSAAHA